MKTILKLSTVAVLCGALVAIVHADVTGKWRGTVNFEVGGGAKVLGSTYTLDLNKSGRCTATFQTQGIKTKPFQGTWVQKDGVVTIKLANKSATMGLFDNPLQVQNDNLIGTIKMMYWSAKKSASREQGVIANKAIKFARI